MEESGILIKRFIKKHLQIEEELQNKIYKLEKEIENLSKAGDDNEYLLYKDILKNIISNIKFEYDKDMSGYIVTLNPPIHMPIEQIDELVKEIKKYRKNLKDNEEDNWDMDILVENHNAKEDDDGWNLDDLISLDDVFN